ncbi:Uma2 family endonuclease [Desulfonema magnum]|uniref:DUF820 n=1 Tax=Desulfonema magnum TaxID=45655 RepID=A0A975GRC3_9BACT|nr:Uma2 family endonuclease [Desulfonema magnum]QTA90792.1 DUF820 [Desulfonema magnum]
MKMFSDKNPAFNFVEIHDSGVVCSAPFQMKTGRNLPGREPDILFVSRENTGRLKETFLDGPADIAAEIISPESRTRDKKEKFSEYEKGGVREYWLIDPDEEKAERNFNILNQEFSGSFLYPD